RNLLKQRVADGSNSAIRKPWEALLTPYRTHVLCPFDLCPASILLGFFTNFASDLYRGKAEVVGLKNSPFLSSFAEMTKATAPILLDRGRGFDLGAAFDLLFGRSLFTKCPPSLPWTD
ncbi:MAG TPA: hypothetical protein VFW94_12225, partial [Candidatus Acidoferrales bacterium]|nr:hypothetical protein [Candidatus Acidoferrales bacterium]